MFRPSQVLLMFMLYHRLVHAAPTATDDQDPATTSVDNQFKRSLFSIVLGCTSTIVISSWRSLHQNIPPRESRLRSILKKLELIVCACFAPEIVSLWAFKQRLAAREARNTYNEGRLKENDKAKSERKWSRQKEEWFSLEEIKDDDGEEEWTLTHGHYLVMGGFHLVEPDEKESSSPSPQDAKCSTVVDQHPARSDTSTTLRSSEIADVEKGQNESAKANRVTVLTLEMLKELAKDTDFRQAIRVTEREINDRSRNDIVSKVIFMLQMSWFIVQCAARGVQRLELTQLELTTVTFASLSIITFIFWMEKPLGAQVPMRVYLKRRLTDTERKVERNLAGRSFRSQLPKYIMMCYTRGSEVLTFRDHRIKSFAAWLFVSPFLVFGFMFSPLIIIISAISLTFYDVMRTSPSFHASATHVPTFYTPANKYSWLQSIVLSLLCVTVGAIHCAGWNLTFPTATQWELWHAASLGTVTIIPFVIFLVLEVIFKFPRHIQSRPKSASQPTSPNDKPMSNDEHPIVEKARAVIFLISVVAYVAARVFLVVQALVLLRDQPPSAFLAVDWTKFLPHA